MSTLAYSIPLISSRSFNKKSWSNFSLVLFGNGWEIRRTTLTNPLATLLNPWNKLKKSMYQFWKVHLTTLTNPTIWAKFTTIIDLPMGWQEKAMIGLGSDKNVNFHPKQCERIKMNIWFHNFFNYLWIYLHNNINCHMISTTCWKSCQWALRLFWIGILDNQSHKSQSLMNMAWSDLGER